MLTSIIASIWLLLSAGIGFWVAHSDVLGSPEKRDEKRKFAYSFAIRPAAVSAIYLATGWQVALAGSLLIGWILRWSGLGLGHKSAGSEKLISLFLLPVYFGYCILFNHAEPLRYFFAFSFTLMPFTQLKNDKKFQSVVLKMGTRSRSVLLWMTILLITVFLGLVEVVWRIFGVDGWIWVFAYFPLVFMILTVAIVVPLAHRFPDLPE